MNRRSLLALAILLACGAGFLTVGVAPAPGGKLPQKYTETITTKTGKIAVFKQ